MRYIRIPTVLAAMSALLPVAAADGQSNEALDPDSPAGVEYQLPLDQARKNAAVADGQGKPASRGARGGDSGSVPLFGAGIVAEKTGDERAGEGRRGGDEGGGQGVDASGPGGGDGRGGRDTSAGSAALRQSALPSPGEDGGSAALRIAGVAAAVLLFGALLGLLLGRGLRRSET